MFVQSIGPSVGLFLNVALSVCDVMRKILKSSFTCCFVKRIGRCEIGEIFLVSDTINKYHARVQEVGSK